jgi:hypothetical protein
VKKKIGTVMEEDILAEAKARAAREHRPLSDLLQDALVVYLENEGPRADSERSCKLFCSHKSRLELDEINELLEEDVLAI